MPPAIIICNLRACKNYVGSNKRDPSRYYHKITKTFTCYKCNILNMSCILRLHFSNHWYHHIFWKISQRAYKLFYYHSFNWKHSFFYIGWLLQISVLNSSIFHLLNADEHSKFFYNESQILFNLSNMQTKHAGMENFSLIRASTNLKHFYRVDRVLHIKTVA